MSNHLVVTAMGDDRPGIVSKFASDCDIVEWPYLAMSSL